MTTTRFSRRDFSTGLASFLSVVGGSIRSPFADNYGISHMSDAIHQEVVFKASRKRIYDALTDTKQFDRIIQLSQARMSYGKKPTDISREVGGAFSIFGELHGKAGALKGLAGHRANAFLVVDD